MTSLLKQQLVDIEFSNLCYSVQNKFNKGKKIILNDLCGSFKSGQLCALMGPSGAGKTSLLNILTGYRVSNVEGKILVNGRKMNASRFRRMACFIMQDDIHLPHFTVNEAMAFSCSLKLGNTVPQDKKNQMIKEILKTLGLFECCNTRTINLSGGQRKRLSIAVEMVNNPPVMFFDEPTSGLDSQSSFQCINLLRTLAEEGKTIICTIHQPSARLFEKFDYLYAMASGQCIYKGPVKSLIQHLTSLDMPCPAYHNPADFLIEITGSETLTTKLITSAKKEKLPLIEDEKVNHNLSYEKDCQIHRKSYKNSVNSTSEEKKSFLSTNGDVKINITENGSKELADNGNQFVNSQAKQFGILLKRNFTSILRDSMLTKLRIISHLAVGLLFGFLYLKIGNEASTIFSNTGLIFCCITFTIFAGLMPTLLTFPLEMKVFIREHHNCWYSLKSYYLAKMIADFPFQVIYPTMFSVIVYFMTNQPSELTRFSMFTGVCIMTSFVAQGMGIAIGTTLEIQEATFFAPVISIPILLFSGFFISYKSMPVYIRWLTYLSYVRYSFQASMTSIYGFDREKLDCSEPYCHFKVPEKFLKEMDVQGSDYFADIGALFGFAILLRIFAYFLFRRKIRADR